ncbi:hypothetical protein CS0771_57120 [Catellatospora sp. IY07-71]|uniref:hypothetical protein n=1 Tax=Catellatospora sp. IY07-71 TaxID=2728827 RepID=UPI001BB393B6|nr:hypothetical protein [Catellatospora sp. IY07-71]BCJ76168.1 hypothetical protein CS0771_57120 [Catellatospora sp. IY07-71]
MGREVLLVRDDENRLLLVELRRFAEDGTKFVRFAHGYVELADGARWRLLRRTSTIAGMTREITSGELVDEGTELIMVPGDFDDLENEPAALAHAEAARRRIEEGGDLLTCLVCGRQISEHLSYAIEIDDDSHPYEVGAVHRGCLRPTHRVLGRLGNDVFNANPLLFDFDFKTWVNSLRSGQGLFNSVRESGRTGVITIQWNPDNASFTTGAYGVAYETDDGTTHYVRARGKVQRMSRSLAERAAEEMNQAIDQGRAAGDPWCSNSHGFAPYSVMVTSQNPNPPRVTMASARELTRATVSAHNAVENYYAPLFYLTDRESGQTFALADAVLLLSDPLRLGELLGNWKHAEIVFPPYSTVIIADDRDFDLFMREIRQESMIALVDPVFDTKGNLVGGFRIVSIHETVARAVEAVRTS